MKKRLIKKLLANKDLLANLILKGLKREIKVQGHFKDHDIVVRQGSFIMNCYKYRRVITNPIYIKNQVCPDCGKLQANGNLDGSYANAIRENESLKNQELPQQRTTLICDKDNLVMEQVSSGIFYCKNGHKKLILDLVPVEERKKEESKLKRKRRLEETCPYCGKVAEIKSERVLPSLTKIMRTYSCGHTQLLDKLAVPSGRDEKWNKMYEFQQKGVEFVENANYRAQIGDEMGLGKTIQALMTLRYNYAELTPCLMICEAAKVYDWKSEFNEWVADKFTEINDEPIIHGGGKYGLCPAFNNHIISMSLLQKPKVLESILKYGFKFVIVDESHSFKNEDAERTYALQQICKEIPHVLFLSGTPIMNRVMEYFVPLNILRPSHIPSKDFLASRCDKAPNGKILGLSDWYRPKFFRMIEDYVIRRTKKDAGLKLPELRLNKHQVAVDQERILVTGYNNILDEIQEVLNKKNEEAGLSQSLLGLLAKLRHMIGVQKIKPTIQLVNEFLESTESEDKICIGVHHQLVMEKLAKGLAEYNPICISDEDGLVKMKKLEEFKTPGRRVLIASILGAGQGLNIQFCKNAIVMEREWNPAKEDQFCGRFHRIVKNADGSIKTDFVDGIDSVTIDYLNAKDTLDEMFEDMIEMKKQIVGSTLDQEFDYDPDFIMELAKRVVAKRLKYAGS